jgi:hypothetical protein
MANSERVCASSGQAATQRVAQKTTFCDMLASQRTQKIFREAQDRGIIMKEPVILAESAESSVVVVRKRWAAPEVIVSAAQGTNNNIPFGGTPDGSFTFSPGNTYKYGS